MKHAFVCVMVLILFLQGCKQDRVNIVTYDLKRGDFIEKIQTSGTTQAVSSVSVTGPTMNFGDMVVNSIITFGSSVKKGDTVCILDCAPLMTYLDRFKDNLITIQAELTKTEADNALKMSMLLAQVDKNKAQMAISQLDSIQMKFAPPVKKRLLALELEKARVEEKKLNKKLEAQKKIIASDIRQNKSRIIQAENYVNMLQEQVDKLTVVAPVDGIFLPSSVWGILKKGSNVWSEMQIGCLPDLNEMQVAVDVPEVEYKRIEKGQKVTIRVNGSEEVNTTGLVKKKALAGKKSEPEYYDDGEPKKQSNIKVYEVIISIDSCHLKIKPGITAKCDILVNLTKDTIVIPTMAIFERDSAKWVFVAHEDKFVRVKVETGLSNSSQTIIAKGLVGNETIALMEPPLKYIDKSHKETNE
ncbi:MAG: hypothetical protein V2A67_01210 [Bacteroidota bacterium]